MNVNKLRAKKNPSVDTPGLTINNHYEQKTHMKERDKDI
jgi:hypothetical protein